MAGTFVSELVDLDNGDTLSYIAHGHVDIAEFVKEIAKEFEIDVDEADVVHCWAHTIPIQGAKNGEYWVITSYAPKSGHGWYKATYIGI